MRELLKEFWAYARARKKFWLLPIILILLLFGLMIVSVQGSVMAPFVYTFF